MTDSCNGDPSHADTILCLESPTLALVTRCGPRYNEGGKEPPSRSRFYRHASPLALGRGPVPLPFCLPPLIVPIFFSLFSFFYYTLLLLLLVLSSFANDSEWFQPSGFSGETRCCDRLCSEREGKRQGDPVRLRCIVSLLHSFLILIMTDLRSELTKTMSETFLPYFNADARFPRFSRVRALVLRVGSPCILSLSLSPYPERTLVDPVRNSRDYRSDTTSREVVLRHPLMTRLLTSLTL